MRKKAPSLTTISQESAVGVTSDPLVRLASLLQGEPLTAHPSNPKREREGLVSLLEQGIVWQGDPEASASPPSRLVPDTIPFGSPALDGALPDGGLTCGAVHEFYYDDPTGVDALASSLPALLAGNAVKSFCSSPASAWRKRSKIFPYFLVWIGKRAWPSPYSLDELTLRSCLFVDPPSQKLALWSLESALRSAAVKLVVVDCPKLSLTMTRRFALAARAHATTAILLKGNAYIDMPSAAYSKWVVAPQPSAHPYPSWRLTLAKIKGAAPAACSWVVGLESRYEEGQKVSLRVLPSLVDRRDGEKAEEIRFGT